MNRRYPAKLILFGEYSLLLDSQVLGVPLNNYYGIWGQKETPASVLKPDFYDYLIRHCSEYLDPQKVEEIKNGKVLYNSSIRRGYGIGSSGALSAAVFDYCKKEEINDRLILQEVLAQIEGFFHGKSSGFDPLLSYLDSPILKDKEGVYSTPEPEKIASSSGYLYLLDSGSKRKVKGLVPLFAERAAQLPDVYQELVSINDLLIEALLNQQSIKPFFRSLSQFHLDHMSPMILEELMSLWKQGLDSEDFLMKICGAGGGGYYIVYSENKNLADRLKAYQLEPITLT